ncbi:MAG: uroporphyrinogen decarboxylase family protein [Planctomycetota bacterium]|jgi:hypothetical protein
MTNDVSTLRDSVLDALRTKRPQRDQFMPLCFFDYFTDMPGYADADDELEFRANFHESVGATFMDWCGGNAYRFETDPPVKISTVDENDGLRGIETFTTPVGSLTQVYERRPDLNAAFIVKPMLETEADLRVYRYILEAEDTIATPEAAQKWLDTVGGRGIAMQPGCNIPFKRLMYSFGPEKFLVMAMEGLSEAVTDLFPIIHEKGLAQARILADSPIQVINHQGSWDIGQLSPKLFGEYYVPYLKEYTDILHETGTISGDHISGHDVILFADQFEASGMDFLYGINLTPDSAPHLRDLADKWEGKLMMVHGVDPMALWYDSPEVSRAKMERFRTVHGDRKIIFGTADAAVAGTPPETLEMAVDILTRRGT